jgi:hypothetical protein
MMGLNNDDLTSPESHPDGWRDHTAHVYRLAQSVGLALRSGLRLPGEWRLCRDQEDLFTGSLDEVESYLGHEKLWDPTGIDHEVWHEIGVDPTSLTSDVAGSHRVGGFKRCGGKEFSHGYAISVWSQLHSVEDFRRTQPGTAFAPVAVAGRVGFRYRPTFDHRGDQCDLVFPAVDGSCSIEVLRLDHRSRTTPVDRILAAAQILVPNLPLR